MLVVWTVRAEFPAGGSVSDVGLSVQVAFEGQPLTVKATIPLNPFKAVAVVVYVALAPIFTVCEGGVADKEKSGVVTPQPVNLKEPMRVFQLKLPFLARYSVV